MASTHFSISIVQASKDQSAVAAAAYQSGSRLYCEHDLSYKNYTSKTEVIYEEVLLPANAPPEFKNRELLWNSVEEVELKATPNAQLARKIIIGIPNEIPKELWTDYVKEFCKKKFVSKGMCCDVAIHDKGDGNPHVHIQLTMRPMDETGKWLPKSKKVYDLDQNGERIRLPSGNFKSHKVNTVDWNEQKYCELWRQSWEEHTNNYLSKVGSKERIDMRSYKRQGISKLPTSHLGAAAAALENKGVKTNTGNHNREVSFVNDLFTKIELVIASWLEKLKKRRLDQKDRENLFDYLSHYIDIRCEERSTWSHHAQVHCEIKDLGDLLSVLSYMDRHNIHSHEEFVKHMERGTTLSDLKKTKESRIKEIENILNARALCNKYRPVIDKYNSIFFKKGKENFYQEHKDEIDTYFKKRSYLNHMNERDNPTPAKDLQSEKKRLSGEVEKIEKNLSALNSDVAYPLAVKIYRKLCKAGFKEPEKFTTTPAIGIKDRLEVSKERTKEYVPAKKKTIHKQEK